MHFLDVLNRFAARYIEVRLSKFALDALFFILLALPILYSL